jgi:iron complex transport system permease protein
MTTSSSLRAERVLRALPRASWPLGAVLLAGSVVLAITVGAADLAPSQVLRSVGAHLGLGRTDLPPLTDSVVWDLRVPRVLLAGCVGAALAVCGCVLQALTRNALADPYLLGISSGASTGAVSVLVLGIGSSAVGLAGGAFLGGLLAFGVVLLLGGDTGVRTALTRFVLTGVAVGQLASSVTSLILLAGGDAESLRGITYWLLGSLSGARWDGVGVAAAAAVAGLVLTCWYAGTLDAFTFGPDAAAALGVEVRRVRLVLLSGTALVTAGVVAVSGAIGFVGLVLPHLVRRLTGGAHRRLVPASAFAGAIFLIWADALARSVFAPRELPVGIVTALVGVPAFLVVLARGRRP